MYCGIILENHTVKQFAAIQQVDIDSLYILKKIKFTK